MKKFSIYTLGCKVNQYESEAISELFEKNGYQEVDFEKDTSDIYIINTCTVTNLSDRKSRQFIRRAKRDNPNSTVIVVGCYSQTSPKEVSNIDGVDIIIGTTERSKIVDLYKDFDENKQKINIVRSLKGDKDFQSIHTTKERFMTRSYMKVQDGCNKFCSYCIIPYARGEIRSRSIEDCVNEAKILAESGYKEIILTGIDISSYGYDLGKERLIDLIEHMSDVNGIERIRMSSVDPRIISEDFMKRVSKTQKLCDHFHLSLQSGSEKTLKRMNRHYTPEYYYESTNIIREYMPNAGLTTDVIVGFPGETENDFLESYDFIKKIKFSKVHVFKYSKRANTPAAEMEDQIDEKIKKKRSKILINLSDELMQDFILNNQNKFQKVLIEEKMEKGYYEGYTTNYIRCRIKSDKDIGNIIKNVKIIGIDGEIAEIEDLKE